MFPLKIKILLISGRQGDHERVRRKRIGGRGSREEKLFQRRAENFKKRRRRMI